MGVTEPHNVEKSGSKYKWVGSGTLRVLVGVNESPQSVRVMKVHQSFIWYSVWRFSLAIWNWTSLRLAMIQSADRPLIGPSMVATLSWIYASATRELSGDCMIFGTCSVFCGHLL